MSRSAKFVGKQLDCVVGMLSKHGQKGTIAILRASKDCPLHGELAALRNAKVFPEAVTVSAPTLVNIGKAHGVKLTRGKPNPVKTPSQKRYVAGLVKKMGSLKAVAILAGSERNVKLFPQPITITSPTLCKIARLGGVELCKGRRAA